KLFTAENQERVRTLLAQTDLDEAGCERFSSLDSLRAGQRVLRQECVSCHDLRTVLAKPRTPQRWRQTVSRMADRASLLDPFDEEQQWQVTAYLIALSPELQQSVQKLSQEQGRQKQVEKAAQEVAKGEKKAGDYDAAAAKKLFETKCSQCHKPTLVNQSPPQSADDARKLVAMMVEEGLEATPEEISQIVQYLIKTHAKSKE
ncbi:MAG: cytochrome c, partial [Pirellulales bacterium]|nr:cytochrome c [Pirellulales bacterium]